MANSNSTAIVLVIFYVLASFLLLAAATYFIYYYNKALTCQLDPNYWCFGTWTCNTDDPQKRYPVKDIYCHGSNADDDYCSKPENKNKLACLCQPDANGIINPACTCTWGDGGNDPLPSDNCGNRYCSSSNGAILCEGPPS